MYHKLLLFVALVLSLNTRGSIHWSKPYNFGIMRHYQAPISEKFGLHFEANYLRPHPLLRKFNIRSQKTKKYVAAALAFPFPFGIVGLHRIYLGCQPYVPVAYIATVGGGFGVLPFIDFCAILSHKNTDPFVDNKKVFMWIK